MSLIYQQQSIGYKDGYTQRIYKKDIPNGFAEYQGSGDLMNDNPDLLRSI
jgi:hypothetical protein